MQPPTDPDRALAAEDLARSGLTLDDLEALGGRVASAAETRALGHSMDAPSIVFPYWDAWKKEFVPLKDFHRVRYLGRLGGFAAQAQKPQRYSQPKGSLNHVYVPRVLQGKEFDWAGYLTKERDPLYITEGEKKAACAAKAGVPCVALGGVTVWSANSRGARELPFFEQVEWRGRPVIVAFDSDGPSGLKPEVLKAARSLMDHLLFKGATPSLLVLPSDGKKVGLDDYIVAHGADEFRAEVVPRHAIEHADAKVLIDCAERFGYLRDIDRFAPLRTDEDDARLTCEHLDHALGVKEVAVPRLERARAPGGGFIMRYAPKAMRVSQAYLTWSGAKRFSTVVYRPGEERVLPGPEEQTYLNLWTGWRCEYVGADRLPSAAERSRVMREWFWVLDNVFGDDPIAREFVEHWIFYPMRHPGAKLATLALVCSPTQGIGKSFIGHMLAKHVYGLARPGPRHAWHLTEGDLHGQFNPYLNAISFIEGDDVAAHDRKSVYERIKSFVTSDAVSLNLKNVPQYMTENRANFWLTSNDAAPFALADQDRRAFVHISRAAKTDLERFHRLQLDFDERDAGAVLLHHAREKYDAKNFNPQAHAPHTSGRSDVIASGQSSARAWVAALLHATSDLSRPFATPSEIYALFKMESGDGGDRANADWLGRDLASAGLRRWRAGTPVAIKDAQTGAVQRTRVWILDPTCPAATAEREELERMFAEQPRFGRRDQRDARPATVVPIAGGKKF